MRALSNAFFKQAEFEQLDHWEQGPMELVFFDTERSPKNYEECIGLTVDWNGSYEGGFIRPGDTVEKLQEMLPGFENLQTPNVFIVPRVNGACALDLMLASLVPQRILERHGILKKQPANIWLTPLGLHELPADFSNRCQRAFEEYIWPILIPGARYQRQFFAVDSPIRLLAADSRLWMSRIYRTALSLWEEFPVTTEEETSWKELDEIREKLFEQHPTLAHESVVVRRPRMGGALWDIDDEEECREILEMAIEDGENRNSLREIVELVLRSGAHEDFSNRYSWIKEDFEKSFYSKRAKFKVTLVETVDNFPAWNVTEPEGYENVLYRDIIALLDLNERHLVLALRHGKTMSEIAKECGYASHSPISRAVGALKAKVMRMLR